ncbi:hypothetical protein COP2_010949 [Malus domestica]
MRTRGAPCIRCLKHSRASSFRVTRAQAKLGQSHNLVVILSLWKVLMDLDFIIFVPAMFKQELPYVSISTASEGGQDRTLIGVVVEE